MMNIIGCFKLVPDLEMLGVEEWKTAKIGLPDTSFLRRVYSCYDESVLELVLRAKDIEVEKVKISALTVKKNSDVFSLNSLFAVGYDQVVEIESGEEQDVVSGIVEYVKTQKNLPILVMGSLSTDFQGAQIPYEVAEYLGYLCVANVQSFQVIGESSIRVTQIDGNVERQLLITNPCVLIIGNVPKTYLRIPTLAQKLATKNKMIEKFELEVCHVKEKKLPKLIQASYINKERKPEFLTIEAFQELARRELQREGNTL